MIFFRKHGDIFMCVCVRKVDFQNVSFMSFPLKGVIEMYDFFRL